MGRAVAGQTKTFGIELGSVANAGKFQVNPTLDAADFRLSINGGAFTALTNTPTVSPAGGAQVVVVIAAAETTSAGPGGRIHFRASDSSGGEWQDLAIDIEVFATAEDTLVTLADGAITAVKIATDAIAGAKVAADAVTKIQTGLATPTNITAGTITTVTNLTNPVTVGTNNDKTDYVLSIAGVQAIWDALTSALTTAGSIGKLLVDNINATIDSRSSHNAADVRTEMDANSTKLANLDATVSSRSTLTAAQVWDTLTSALSTVGSIGKLIVDNLNDTITSRMATFVYTAPPAVGDVADAIWDEATVGHTTPGTFGEQLKTDVDAILLDIGTNGVVLSTAQMEAIADIVLTRGSAGLDNSAAFDSIYEAIGMLLRGNTSTGDLVIKETDGVTTFNTRPTVTDLNAAPIVGIG